MMTYESMSRNLMNYGMTGFALMMFEEGNKVAWMLPKGDDYEHWTSWNLDFDMLSGFDSLKEIMKTETLIISCDEFNIFKGELSHEKRVYGSKGPFCKEVYDTANGYSILEVLSILNEREKSKQTVDGSKLELLKMEN